MTLKTSQSGVETVNDSIATPLQHYLDLFIRLQEALSAAATTFRDRLYLNAADCDALVQYLRDLRRTSRQCHQFWLNSGAAGHLQPLHRNSIASKLGVLQGEATAALLLQVDTFKYLLITIPGTVRDAGRIRMHVRLETLLTRKAATVASLISLLRENLEAAQASLQPTSDTRDV